MNQQLKTVLLTVLTLSAFVIALVELSGVSKTALLNKFDSEQHTSAPKDMASMPKTTIEFVETNHNFGTINDGDVVTHAYKFKNTGDNPLVINNAVASCGCTVPSYPKEPVSPGATGEVVVQFNSKGKKGHQHKNVLISSNAQQESMSIGFDADVIEK